MNHIQLNVGNVVFITAVSLIGIVTVATVVHYASNKQIPVLSRTARGATDFVTSATGKA